MAAFQYTALDKNSKRIKGVVEADSARAARAQLRKQYMTPLSIEEISDVKKNKQQTSGQLFSFSRKISAADLSLLTRQMSTLLQAGLPIDEVLTALSEQTEKQTVKRILLGVRAKVLEGYGLASAMDDFPSAFPPLYRTTVAAGERTGKIGPVLDKLADYTEKQHHIAQRIQQALIYPSMMTLVSVSIVIFLLIYVVPKIVAVFNQTNQTLPLATRFLINVSGFIQHDGMYLLIALIGLIFLWTRALKKEKFRRKIQGWILKIPVLGNAIRTINCARFGRTFGILNAAAVPVLEAMQASAALVKPIPMREKIEESIAQVREGSAIHVALQKSGYFAPMFLHLVASGEASGQLDLMLEKAAQYLENDVEALIQATLTLFEPLMIIVMGGIVLYIVLAIMLPIFALDQVK
ncbi:MAG: type II secretion system protein GspF [Gammaproteobacteria bacterium RIFCSPHIGHO2_12_FULL_38_14]|nr:MAG: type II secretion system protein GspF [Gammaproteobacteria bacterium RIFCSPHIGHO2_12_FULL_38_14]